MFYSRFFFRCTNSSFPIYLYEEGLNIFLQIFCYVWFLCYVVFTSLKIWFYALFFSGHYGDKKSFYDIFVLQVLMDFLLQKQALSKSLVAYILNPFSGFSSITFPFSFEWHFNDKKGAKKSEFCSYYFSSLPPAVWQCSPFMVTQKCLLY